MSSLRLRRSAVAAWTAAGTLVAMLGGCFVQDQRPVMPVVAQKATAEIPERELLDVGVRLFDPATDQPVLARPLRVGLPPFSIGFVP